MAIAAKLGPQIIDGEEEDVRLRPTIPAAIPAPKSATVATVTPAVPAIMNRAAARDATTTPGSTIRTVCSAMATTKCARQRVR